jgi:hypothetical protein
MRTEPPDDTDHDQECLDTWSQAPTADSDEIPNARMEPLPYCRHGTWRNPARGLDNTEARTADTEADTEPG